MKKDSMAVFFPEEILLQILKWLPVKSLLRFMCVCKPWNSLISSPEFVNAHLNTSLKTGSNQLYFVHHIAHQACQSFSLNRDNDSLDQIALCKHPLGDNHVAYLCLNGCVNGLLCFYDNHVFSVFLWNPSIRRFWALPELIVPTHFARSIPQFGFGFDSRYNDYKVVRVLHLGDDECLAQLFSLRGESWKDLPASLPELNSTIPHVYFNAKSHWVSFHCDVIVAFDMVNEEFREISLPESIELGDYDMMAVWHKSLSLLVGTEDCPKIGMWVMKEYGVEESWVKQFSIDIVGGLEKFAGFRNSGEMLMIGTDGCLVSHCMDTLETVDSEVKDDVLCGVLPYVESLVLMKEGVSYAT